MTFATVAWPVLNSLLSLKARSKVMTPFSAIKFTKLFCETAAYLGERGRSVKLPRAPPKSKQRGRKKKRRNPIVLPWVKLFLLSKFLKIFLVKKYHKIINKMRQPIAISIG